MLQRMMTAHKVKSSGTTGAVMAFESRSKSDLDPISFYQTTPGANVVALRQSPKSESDARDAANPPVASMPVGGALKRAFDIMGAAGALLFFAPLMLVISALLSLEGGPVFFAHKRIGFGGKSFGCLKFRSMIVDAEAKLEEYLAANPDARAQWRRERKLDNDPRITRLGKILRVTSLDELPQFINVLKGEMSLVGPRPITRDEAGYYGEKFTHYLACRPGITGAWQVSGRSDTSYNQRVDLDATYALGHSVMIDMDILFRTAKVVLERTGAK